MIKRFKTIFITQLFAMFLNIVVLYLINFKLKHKLLDTVSWAPCYNSSIHQCILSSGFEYIIFSIPIVILTSLIKFHYKINIILLEIYFIFILYQIMFDFVSSAWEAGKWSEDRSIVSSPQDLWYILIVTIVYFFFLKWYLKPKAEIAE